MSMTTNKQTLRGQSVEGSHYLAECGYCGQVMPSSGLRALHSQDGEADCYCPHCNAEDCEIFDLGIAGSEVVNAWNYQQKRIEALLDQLEAAERRNAELEMRFTALLKPTMSQLIAGKRQITTTGKMSRLMLQRLADIYRAMIGAAATDKGE